MKNYNKLRAPSISILVNNSFDLGNFKSLINIQKLQLNIEKEGLTDILLADIQEKSSKIITSLSKLNKTVQNIDELGKTIDYDINWIFQGREELVGIFQSIDLLEYNVNILLSKFDNNINTKYENILDEFNTICNYILEIKKIIFSFKKRLGIANHHNEIEKQVLTSVNNEISYCTGKLDELNEKKEILNIEKEFNTWSLEQFKKKIEENNRNPDNSSGYHGLIITSVLDAQIFDSYTSLHDTIVPISQSLKLIPKALDDFYQTSKLYYKDLVLENIEKYENLTILYNKYRHDLKKFKAEYITKRINMICQRIFTVFNSEKAKSKSSSEDVIHILRPIENYYGLNEEYSAKLKEIEDNYYNIQLNENFQTPQPRNRLLKGRRAFSNPLVESLNMKPILTNNNNKKRCDIKIFQTPRNVDGDIYSKDNIELINNIKSDVEEFPIRNILSTSYSPQSTDSSPDAMRTRNIFDSPDPFITPNSRSFHKSKLPISTPLTTPRITPTKSNNRFSITDSIKHRKEKIVKNNVQEPLLRFELSTVVKVDSDEGNISHISNISNMPTISNESSINISDTSDELMMTPNQSGIPTSLLLNNVSPPVKTSRIPLPKRPESRLDMLRSVSRLQMDRSNIMEKKSTPTFNRAESRLENMASSISIKLGTNSPVLASKSKIRPATVMSQRDIKSFQGPRPLGRNNDSFSKELVNLKVRGVTSLGARHMGKSRISSV